MKNVPRMMDYERVVSFDSALGIDMMNIINKPKEHFNGSISNLLHLIERSFDWSKSLLVFISIDNSFENFVNIVANFLSVTKFS